MSDWTDSLLRLLRSLLNFIFHIYALIFWPDKKGTIPPFTDRLLLKPAVEVSALIKSGKLTSEAVVRAYIKRIKEVNPLTNSIIDERFDEAIQDAKAIDAAVQAELAGESTGESSILDKPLIGVPFSCKDSFAIKGMRLCAALPQRKNIRAEEDAQVIANLRASKCIPLVVGNVPEMLLWWTADNKTFGRTNNPYDLSRISGGSSGGDTSLLSSGGVLLAVGSDIGGSIRIPCCMCGVFGHKSTSGVISCHGKWPPLARSREKYFAMGPMTRFACDLKPMLKIMAGENVLSKLPRLDDPVDFSKVTFFYMLDDEDPFKTRVDPHIKDTILSIVSHFNSQYKSKMKQVVYTDFRHCTKMFLSSIQETAGEPMIKLINSGNRGNLNPYTEFLKALLGFGDHTLHVTLYSLIEHHLPPPGSKFSIEGVKMRDKLSHELGNLLSGNCVLILPSYPTEPPKHGTTVPNNQNIHYFTMLNLLGLPATQVPIGLSGNSLPLGIQVAADKFNDHLTLAVAEEIEKILGGWVPPAPYINHQTAPM